MTPRLVDPYKDMLRIYIGHPLFGNGAKGWSDREQNVRRYLHFVALFTNAGHVVLSWVHHNLTHDLGLTKGDADFYLKRDREFIRISDVFIQAGPEEVSHGLVSELADCKEFKVPVYSRLEWMKPEFLPEPSEVDQVSHWLENALVPTGRLRSVPRGV